MLRPSHFLQFVPPRIIEVLGRIQNAIWTVSPTPLAVAQAEPTREHLPFEDVGKLKFRGVNALPCHWGVKQFDQCWWRVEMPEASSEERRYLRWKDQAEATVYVDGIPYYGLDPAHAYCPLPAETREVYIESLCGNVGIWTADGKQGIDDEGSRFDGAFLAARNDRAWQAYHDLETLWQLIQYEHRLQYPSARPLHEEWGYREPMPRLNPAVRRLLRRVNDACDIIDRNGLAALKQELGRIYEEFRNDQPWAKCILTGHAHLDLVWLWTEKAGEFKAVHTCATQSRLMELYPELTFGFSQPAGYRSVFRRAPRFEPVLRPPQPIIPTRMTSLPAAYAFRAMNCVPATTAEAATAELFKKSRRVVSLFFPDCSGLFMSSPLRGPSLNQAPSYRHGQSSP